MKAIVGRKMGMTEVFTEDGQIYAVTVVEVKRIQSQQMRKGNRKESQYSPTPSP